MNLTFFFAAIALYLIATAGYCIFFVQPERKSIASVALWAASLGFASHFIYFILRWVEGGRIPVTNFFEAISALGMGIVFVFLIMELRYRIAALGTFMLPLVLVLMAPAALTSRQITGLDPVLRSAWLGIHTSLALLGDAAFAFAFIVSIMYLIQEHQLKHKRLGAIFHRLPPLDVMDTISYRALSIGWPLFTLGMITGFHLGGERLGDLLELAAEGDGVAPRVGPLPGGPAPPDHRMAGPQDGMALHRRVPVRAGQLLCREQDRGRKAYVLILGTRGLWKSIRIVSPRRREERKEIRSTKCFLP